MDIHALTCYGFTIQSWDWLELIYVRQVSKVKVRLDYNRHFTVATVK